VRGVPEPYRSLFFVGVRLQPTKAGLAKPDKVQLERGTTEIAQPAGGS